MQDKAKKMLTIKAKQVLWAIGLEKKELDFNRKST